MTSVRTSHLAVAALLLTAIFPACGPNPPTGGQGGSGGQGGAGGSAGTSGSAGTGGQGGPVAVPGVACGPSTTYNLNLKGGAPAADVPGSVVVAYPCDKPAGTPATFVLNLHGTMPTEGGKFYQHVYFGAYKHVNEKNFIVASPKAVTSQWENPAAGTDRAHLFDVIRWVKDNLGGTGKFDIRNMWVVGHSWGSVFTNNFVCDANLAIPAAGAVLMSGAGLPPCADRISVLATQGENDIPGLGVPDQTAIAAAHGCDAQRTYDILYPRPDGTEGRNVVTEWPNCDAKWVHKNYVMMGKGHGFSPVDWPDDLMLNDMVAAILHTR
ncbi:MAG TPA: hypothetical protein VI072_28050 [Polyangiaceae bacterium]